MSKLASGLHWLRRSPWEVLWSALVSCGLVLFSQLAVAMVPRLFPSLSLLDMLPIAGLVFLAAIVLGRFWRRFIGVAASAPLFVVFNILFMWGAYVFVIRRDTSLLDMLINAERALLLWGLDRCSQKQNLSQHGLSLLTKKNSMLPKTIRVLLRRGLQSRGDCSMTAHPGSLQQDMEAGGAHDPQSQIRNIWMSLDLVLRENRNLNFLPNRSIISSPLSHSIDVPLMVLSVIKILIVLVLLKKHFSVFLQLFDACNSVD